MPSRLSRIAIIAGLTAALTLAAACGGGDDSPSDPPPIDATPSGPTGSPAPTRDLGTTVPVTVVTGGDATVLIATAPDGPFLTDAQGMTVYITLNDTPDSGSSSCLASCANLWPPLVVEDAPVAPDGLTGSLGVISRPGVGCTQPVCPDVSQVTYNGLPLYLYANDEVPGDMSARDLGGIWSIVRP